VIYPIKVWSRKGLRQLLRHDLKKSMDAKQVLEKQQKHYELSRNERAKFDTMKLSEIPTKVKIATHKYPAHAYQKGEVYKIKCAYCGKEAERSRKNAKYCSDECYRTYYSRKQYQQKKGERNATKRRGVQAKRLG